jgi:hypothetical protein
MGITSEMNFWIKVITDIVVVLVIYNVLLLVVGFIFGQFRFFLEFEKKFFSKLMFRKKQTTAEKFNNIK